MQMEHFFSPILGEDQKKKKVFIKDRKLFLPDFRGRLKRRKKKVFNKNRTFSPNLRSDVHPFKLLEDADVDHSQTIGEDTAKLLGGIYPPSPPGFGTPGYYALVRSPNYALARSPNNTRRY